MAYSRGQRFNCPRGTLVHSERGRARAGKSPYSMCERRQHVDTAGESQFRPVHIARTVIRSPTHVRRAVAPGPVFWLRTFFRSPSHPARGQTVAFDRSFNSSLQRRVRVGISPTSLHDARLCRAPRANCRPRAVSILEPASRLCKSHTEFSRSAKCSISETVAPAGVRS